MTLKLQLTAHAWRTRLDIRLRWDYGRFELSGAGPFCDIVLLIVSDPVEVPYKSP